MTTTTNVKQVKMNIMTQAQYDTITPVETELYAITDAELVTIDSALSASSENPVQNKVIYTALNGKQNTITSSAMLSSDLVDDTNKTHKFATAAQLSQIATNTGDISTINGKIPSAATSSNQLADKSFVNSSISTNTANFIGTFNSVAALEAYSGTVTNNDYAFVTSTDTAGNTLYDRYKYTTSTNPASWVFEYELNNSSFTSDQWAAINSGATTTNIGLISTALQPGDVTSTYSSTGTDPVNGTAVASAISGLQAANTAVTHTASTAVGNSTTPVYVASDGTATALSYTIETSVPSGAVFTDTKNTAGSTDTSSKIYLVGATSQAANPQTYSQDTAFVDTNGRVNSAAPASDANDTTVATTKWVKDQGYTNNTGTVTSVNNVSPVSGNVTLSIPTTTSSITSGSAAALTSGGAYTNVVTGVAAHSTDSDKINVTKAGSTSTITVNNVGYASTAGTASKLGSSDVGSATQPIFLDDGVATACTYTLGKSVPSNAVFTDTTYNNFTGATSIAGGAAGLVPAPSSGDEGKYLKGDGTWGAVSSGSSSLADLSDVILTNPSQGQNLTYDATAGKWKNTSTSATVAWGGITGTLADQTDLKNALDGKLEAVNSKVSFINDGTEGDILYIDTTTGGSYGILVGDSTFGTAVTLGATINNSGYSLQLKNNGLYLIEGTTSSASQYTVLTVSSSNELEVNGTTVALSTDLPSTMTGATSIAGGTSGLVPAPSSGDNDKILTGGATWSGLKTINNTSLLGSGNIGVLVNTATGTNSLTLLGTATNTSSSINIGYNTSVGAEGNTVMGSTATSNGTYATAYGYYARANAQNSTAIGYSSYANYQDVTAVGHAATASAAGTTALGSNSQATVARGTAVGYSSTATAQGATSLGYSAKATATYAHQIGEGTNSTANSLQIGFGTSSNYKLLDGTTGKIPNDRINLDTLPGSGSGNAITSGAVYTALSGKQNSLSAGSNISISGDTISATDTTYSTFTGADSTTAGTSGLVPQPSAGDNDKILTGGATWSGLKTVNSNSLFGSGNISVQETLTSGTNIKTINSTSLLGSGNIDVLQNLATGNHSYSIGTATTGSNTVSIGEFNTSKSATSAVIIGHGGSVKDYAVAIGWASDANATYSMAMGYNADVSANSSIQLGYGTNSTANTLSIGFYNNSSTHYNWKLLDGTTGYIPNARINMDTLPGSGSGNAITSGAVYTALDGKQNTLTAGSNITISGDTISATDTTYSAFTGADSTTGGAAGLVPAPSAGDEGKYLKGDGTWGTVSTGGTVDQTYDGTSANAQSGVAIAGAGFLTSSALSGYLQNTATGTGALTLLGTATNKQNAINIGTNSSATNDATVVIGADAKSAYTNSVAIGYKADANDTQSIAIGHSAKTNYSQAVAIGVSSQATASASVAIGGSAKASANTANAFGYGSEATGAGATTLGYSAKASAAYSIQLGKGTNSTASSLAVGFNGTNYQLLDGTTGYIPNARINMDSSPTSASTNTITSGAVYTALGNKQDTLVSGTNIKTINSTSLLSSGDLTLADTTLSNVSSISSSSAVKTALDTKVNTSDIWYDSTSKTLYIGVAQS